MQEPKLVETAERRLAGLKARMSFVDDRTSELWRTFRSRESEISDRIGMNSFSVKVYDLYYSFSNFDPAAEFDKWAAAEIRNTGAVPVQFAETTIPKGEYAVFIHRGTPADAPRTFGYIFGTWLPNSEFVIDQRPHFEVLPAGYDPFDPEAEEEIWIPVKRAKEF